MADELHEVDPSMDSNNLYREEIFTDHRVGTIQRLTPVTRDGGPDKTRPVLYVGQTQIMMPTGPLPISFDIEATSLGDATAKFGEAAKTAVEQTMERLQELRREVASSIVIPETGSGGLAPGGGGKIKMP